MNDFREYSDYLIHYGVKGMKWHEHLKAATDWWNTKITGRDYQRAIAGEEREKANAIKDIQSGSDADFYKNRGRYLQGYDNNGNAIYGTGSYKDWHDNTATNSRRMNTNMSARADVVRANQSIQYNKAMYSKSLVGRIKGASQKAIEKGVSIAERLLNKLKF